MTKSHHFLANVSSRSLYVIACPSAYRLSVVCNVRAPKSVTLNDLDQRNDRYIALFH